MTDTQDLRRIQVDLGPKAIQSLELLKTKTESTSYAEVFRRAMRLFQGLLALLDQGGSLFVRMPDGSEKKVLIL